VEIFLPKTLPYRIYIYIYHMRVEVLSSVPCFLLSHIRSIWQSIVTVKNFDHENLPDLRFQTPWIGIRGVWNAACLSVCLSVRPSSLSVRKDAWMDACLAGAWTVGQILFIFGIQEFIHPRSVPGEPGDSNSKNWYPLDELRNRKRLQRLSVLYGGHLAKLNCTGGIIQK
jgi:hypothetical protein